MWKCWLEPNDKNKGKYTPGNVYNHKKETLIKNWKYKSLLGLYSSGDIPNLIDHDISESNMRCDIFIRELWHDMSKTIDLLKELNFLVRALNKPDKTPREEMFGVWEKIII